MLKGPEEVGLRGLGVGDVEERERQEEQCGQAQPGLASESEPPMCWQLGGNPKHTGTPQGHHFGRTGRTLADGDAHKFWLAGA